MNEVKIALGLYDAPPQVKKIQEEGDNKAEKIVTIFNNIYLVCGLIGCVIGGISVLSDGEDWGALVLLGGPFVVICQWALVKVFVNISTNIRRIKHELKKQNSNNAQS